MLRSNCTKEQFSSRQGFIPLFVLFRPFSVSYFISNTFLQYYLSPKEYLISYSKSRYNLLESCSFVAFAFFYSAFFIIFFVLLHFTNFSYSFIFAALFEYIIVLISFFI
nr:MAG TPA: hypothetical protein [Inoviridae sp.]